MTLMANEVIAKAMARIRAIAESPAMKEKVARYKQQLEASPRYQRLRRRTQRRFLKGERAYLRRYGRSVNFWHRCFCVGFPIPAETREKYKKFARHPSERRREMTKKFAEKGLVYRR